MEQPTPAEADYAAAAFERLEYDKETGNFRWATRVARRAKLGSLAGTTHKTAGYVYIALTVSGKRKTFGAHRLAWLLSHSYWPIGVIDHIDGCKTNNRLSNLRDTDAKTNCQNIRKAFKTNRSSGLLGAHYHKAKNKWAAEIHFNGRNMHLGYFTSAEAAHATYINAKRELHDGCEI
jgi:hypothetical protein